MRKPRTAACVAGQKNLLLSCFMGATLLLSCPAWSQLVKLAPRLNGQRFVEATGGLTGISNQLRLKNSGWHGSLTTGRYNKNLNAWKWTISYVRKPLPTLRPDSLATANTPQQTLVEQFTVGYGREFVLYKSVFRTFLVRGQMQPFIGYESINHHRQPLTSDSTFSVRSQPLAGADLGLEIEFQPVVLGIRQRWTPTSDVGRWRMLVYVGVRLGWR